MQAVTEQVETCELAFTGDTGPEFITAEGSADALRARLLIMELTFLDDKVTPQSAHVSPLLLLTSAGCLYHKGVNGYLLL